MKRCAIDEDNRFRSEGGQAAIILPPKDRGRSGELFATGSFAGIRISPLFPSRPSTHVARPFLFGYRAAIFRQLQGAGRYNLTSLPDRSGHVSAEKILVADDEEALREVIGSLLEAAGYRWFAVSSGREAANEVARDNYDLVLSDLLMPEMDGLKLLEYIQIHDPDIPVILVTAMHDLSVALKAMREGAYDYILKPFEKEQLYISVRRALEHRRLVKENKTYQRGLELLVEQKTQQLSTTLNELEQSYDYTLEALGSALDARDAETEGHCQRVTAVTITLAQGMGVCGDALRQIARGAFLHDIGKMGIPDSILRKPGPLTEAERAVMRSHCEIGYSLLASIPFLREAAEIVLTHQEHFDGTGYPHGLKGKRIPIGSRIFAVADTLDAMISDRPYRGALPIHLARKEILAHSGTQFDPDVVAAFVRKPDEIWGKLHQEITTPFHLFNRASAASA
jgi:putative nucleotidyltransferase with HDIG domain